MGLILNIETSADVCSVVLATDGKVSAIHENREGQSHARVLTTLISQCMKSAGRDLNELDAIAVSKGPGSFTGLRIGVASAKGLCYALNKPLIGVNTLQSMATALIDQHHEFRQMLLCPMIDARRMEVYTAILNPDLSFLQETSAMIITDQSYSEFIDLQPIVFFGDGAQKCSHLIGNHGNATIFGQFQPTAAGMVSISENSYNQGNFELTAYFEPFYLKDFYSPRQPSTGTARQ